MKSDIQQTPFHFSQIIFSNNFEGILHVLLSPINVIEKTCIVHHVTEPLIRFEGKLINALTLQLLEFGYFSHGIKRLHHIHDYLRDMQVYWGKDTRIVLGQKSAYQNLMELMRSNLYLPSKLIRSELSKISQLAFDQQFALLVKTVARELYFEGFKAGEGKLKKLLKQKKGIFPIIRHLINWYLNLNNDPILQSEIFLFSAMDSKEIHKDSKQNSHLDALKIILPYYYLDTELFTQDLIKDAQALGATIYHANGLNWNIQGNKINSLQLSNSSIQLSAKKYIDATIGVHSKSLDHLPLPSNSLLAKFYKFELSERVESPIYICFPSYHSQQRPWSIGPILFAVGHELLIYYVLDSDPKFWNQHSWALDDHQMVDEIRDLVSPFLTIQQNLKLENSGLAVFGWPQNNAPYLRNELSDEFTSSLLNKKRKGYWTFFHSFGLKSKYGYSYMHRIIKLHKFANTPVRQ